jgi:hypothetical protein
MAEWILFNTKWKRALLERLRRLPITYNEPHKLTNSIAESIIANIENLLPKFDLKESIEVVDGPQRK